MSSLAWLEIAEIEEAMIVLEKIEVRETCEDRSVLEGRLGWGRQKENAASVCTCQSPPLTRLLSEQKAYDNEICTTQLDGRFRDFGKSVGFV